ncbi:Signal recognition particle core component [Schistosoma haematobium]|uniref:Signal recognition particle subunit SRP72 n=1 Tax=Schistosoma haematobium TaxID=6185 RepID=A0A922LYP0_SCHHA|nr:Signal recognition particle core component [Schistosoma haematobium]KAH9596128.1 Signal recognition particle core component [Schistosoma haematobium]
MYEGKFNLACYHLGRGDCHLASRLLDDAENTCNLCLSEDPELTEEEKNEELAPIRVQRAYILQINKEEEEANQVYQSVIRQRASDTALLAVAANNIVCINQDQNIFDSRKRIKMASTDGLQFKLFSRQRTDMLINQALFYWYTNQMEACTAKLRTVLQEELSPRALLLSAAQLIKEKNIDKAVLLLESYLSNVTGNQVDAEIPLALAQINLRRISANHLGTGSPQPKNALNVAQMLENILPQHLIHSPGVLSTRIALYLLASSGENAVQTRPDSMKQIVNCIESTLHYYEELGEQNETYSHLLDNCAGFLLQQGEAKLAAEILEKQLARLESNVSQEKQNSLIKQVLVARLVRAYAQFDRPKAEQTCKSLQAKESLSEADVDTLETTFLYGAKSLKRLGKPSEPTDISDKGKSKRNQIKKNISNTPSSDPGVQQVTSRSKRKKKRIRLPKNYQPGVMPDPNRWLPRRERTHYRGKRRDKRFAPTRGPQGQITGESEWDAAIRSPKVKVHEDGSAGSTPKQMSNTAKQQQKKGRKKGR